MQPASTTYRWRARVGTALAALLVAIGMQSPALAKKDTRNKTDEPPRQIQRELAQPHAEMSLDKIIAAAEKRHGASVVKSDPAIVDGRKVYVLRLLLKNGRVKHIKVDPETGKEL